jgi:hypothetical protein
MFRIDTFSVVTRRIIAGGFGAALLLAGTGAGARADQIVVLKTTDAPLPLMEFARQQFRKEAETSERGLPETFTIEKNVWKGEAVVDGAPERFFIFVSSISCGTIGCAFHVFRKQGNEWRQILDDTANPDNRPDVPGWYVHVLDEKDERYSRICVGYLYEWNGTRYDIAEKGLPPPPNDPYYDEIDDAVRCH